MRVTLDDTSPLLQFVSVDPEAKWVQDSSDSDDVKISKYFRQTMTKTTGQGNYVSLEFNGTEISVYGAKRDNHGNYSVTLDGGEPETQNGLKVNPEAYQSLLYQATKLDVNTIHTIRVTNLPKDNVTSYLDIDYIVIKNDIDDDKVFTTRLDDTSADCQYTGEWGLGPPMTPEMYYNTTAHISRTKGDQVTCNFNGTSIEVIGGVANDHGNYTVSVDGGPVTTLNGSHPSPQTQATLFLATNLNDGPHSITMTNTESGFDLDYMVVNSTTNPSAEVNLSGTTISGPINPGQGPAPTNAGKSSATDGSGNAALIGGVAGAVAGLVLLGILALFFLRRCRTRNRVTNNNMREKHFQYDPPSRSSSIRPSQIDLIGAEISPFTNGVYTYQDSPWDYKHSPLVTAPPQSALAFHSYRPSGPRSPVSSAGTNTLILGFGPVPTPRHNEQRHDRQASISDISNGMPETAVTRAWTRTHDGAIGGYSQPRSGMTGFGGGSRSAPAETTSSGWSPRPRGAQFSLPALTLPPKMFVLGQDGEVEPLGSPGGSGRSSIATKVG